MVGSVSVSRNTEIDNKHILEQSQMTKLKEKLSTEYKEDS
jgi:hypothetical protein